LKSIVERELSVLTGLPLWGCGEAAGMLWLQFGDESSLPTRRGGVRKVGSHALHVQCHWRVRGQGEVLASSEDEGVDAFVALLPRTVESVRADEAGGFQLRLTGEVVFEAVSDEAPSDEQWRLLRPGSAADHFVVGGGDGL
jgi:hypothetical protein